MKAGFFGKHPGFGDFISDGLPIPLREELEAWLTPVLAKTKTQLGDLWGTVYDSARPIRFWIGPSVLTDPGALFGVIWPSRDKVGRRYPLVSVAAAQHVAPPPIATDQSVYADLEGRLCEAMASEAKQPKGLIALDGLGALTGPDTDTLWAVNPNADVTELLFATGAADYARAAQQRSYWWSVADETRAGAVWSCTGLADATALGWLLSGVRPVPEAKSQDGESPFEPTDATKEPNMSEDALS